MDCFVIYGLTIISLIITLLAQGVINFSYSKYSKINNKRQISGYDAARYILDKNGLSFIQVTNVNGFLTDHYDPSNKIIRLSNEVYNGKSIMSVSVACHECGHAIQDKENYSFMRIRSILVPIVNLSSYLGYISIVLGIIFGFLNLIWIGIMLEVIILLFQLITLPVETNASKRALKELDYAHLLDSNELSKGKIVLISAALTYVASVLTTIIQILRLILMFGRRDD